MSVISRTAVLYLASFDECVMIPKKGDGERTSPKNVRERCSLDLIAGRAWCVWPNSQGHGADTHGVIDVEGVICRVTRLQMFFHPTSKYRWIKFLTYIN